MNCENKEINIQNCNCTYSCSKKGVCCECIRYHRSLGELPACYFPNDAERTYDRSFGYFVQLYKQGKIR